MKSLYLADNPVAALLEVEALYTLHGSRLVAVLHEPYAVIAVEGIVGDVLDLTDLNVQKALGTNDQELRGPWLRSQERFLTGRGPLPPTQALGEVAFAALDVAGLKYSAARSSDGVNLVVFTDRLTRSAAYYLESFDTSSGLRQHLP
jgi:RES domain